MQAIVAVSQSWGIGKDGHLLFRISADLQRFKALTTGHTVIMGRKTLESLPGGRGLPNRRNLVLTRQKRFIPDRAEAVHSLEELLALAGSDAFVIGVVRRYTSSCCPIAPGSMSPKCYPKLRRMPSSRAWMMTPIGG